MNSDEVRPNMKVKTTKLCKTTGMTINKKNLDVRKSGVTGTVLCYVPGHGGDVWFVKHDDSEDVGAYCFDEFEKFVITQLEEIMERLMRLDRNTRIGMRDSFPPGPNRWFISQSVYLTGFTGGYCPLGVHQSGSSPEEAAEKYWDQITGVQDSDRFLCRITCKPHVNIPGDTPQVWVRWNQAIDDWEDVPPTEECLRKLSIPADRIIPWKHQHAIDRY